MDLRRTTLLLGVSQLISWGVTYYLIGVFGELIANDLGWSRVVVHGGFSMSLAVMGLSSPIVGWWIDRYGGRSAMAAGSALSALGCIGLSRVQSVPSYYFAWLVLGLAMRANLYDAAFATLARLGGPSAKRPISAITLLGGLASTVFWPIGHALAAAWGWRTAVTIYGGFALLTLPLNRAIPAGRYIEPTPATGGTAKLQGPLAATRAERLVAGTLYAVIVTLIAFLNSGMSAHMIAIVSGLGIATSTAVWIASLRGVGQTLGRTAEMLFGRRVHPLTLNLGAALALPLSFAAALASGAFVGAGLMFTFAYGAANGIMTITRGTVPLVLFDYRSYGTVVGKLLVPSFFISAAAPIVYAFTIDRGGERMALFLSMAVAATALVAAIALKVRFDPKSG